MGEHIDVIGSGASAGTPDVVVLDTRFSCDGRDVAAALEGCTAAVTAALAVATERGIGEADRQSTGIGVNQRWDGTGQKVVGYTAYHLLRLAVRDREHVGDIISDLARSTGNAFGLDSVSLKVADTTALLTQARAAAFADARAKAVEYAGHAGRELGEVLRVQEASAGTSPSPKAFRSAMAEMSAGSMPVEGGESTVTASVAVRFSLR